MTTENSERMKDVGTSNVSLVSKKPLQYIQLITPYAGHVVEVTFEAITMPMICSLMQHSFLPVFSIVGRMMLYSKLNYL